MTAAGGAAMVGRKQDERDSASYEDQPPGAQGNKRRRPLPVDANDVPLPPFERGIRIPYRPYIQDHLPATCRPAIAIDRVVVCVFVRQCHRNCTDTVARQDGSKLGMVDAHR